MKIAFFVFTLFLSVGASASFWHCEGQNAVVRFGPEPLGVSSEPSGLVLSISSKNRKVLPYGIFSVEVPSEGVSYTAGGVGRLGYVEAVSTLWELNREMQFHVVLNIKNGEFTLANEEKPVLFDRQMNCVYSAH